MSDFQQDIEETPVIFRKFKASEGGSVVALFPTEPGTYDPYTCGSFEHVGQHGSADPVYMIQATKAAKPQEYEPLKRELESAPYGYRLKVYRRLQRSFLQARKARLRGA